MTYIATYSHPERCCVVTHLEYPDDDRALGRARRMVKFLPTGYTLATLTEGGRRVWPKKVF